MVVFMYNVIQHYRYRPNLQSVLLLEADAVEPRARMAVYSDTLYSTLRANPYPEVTDLFCRLPLPAFVYRLEATHLGDLMRFWVRPGT